VSDFTYFAWLADVFILPEYQKSGYGQHFLKSILDHPDLEGVRWRLRTKDAHEFYVKLGFVRTTNIERLMER
jgi:GNAT superfamily N-acetyltransferase